MSTIEQQIQNMEPEALFDLVDELSTQYDLNTDRIYSADEIRDLFKLLHGSMSTGNLQLGGKTFTALQKICHAFFDAAEDKEEALDLLIEWSLVAIRFTQEEAIRFACMHVYEDLLEVLAQAPEELRYKRGRILLQMANHFHFWQQGGGNPGDLPEEERIALEQAEATCLASMEEFLIYTESRGLWEEHLKGHRTLFRYYLVKRKPNEAIAAMKEMIAILPQTPDYQDADTADAYMTLGQIFLEYSKPAPAMKYFEKAREIYEAGGEETEMFMYQAEGWIEECKKKL